MTPAPWVVDASPLIVLAKVGRLALINDAGRRILIPSEVAAEVRTGPQDDPARRAIEGGFGGKPVEVETEARVMEWGLGRGESAVLTLAGEAGGTAILDDREARAAAKVLGLPVIGTLGLVLLARRETRIDSAAEVLRDLQRAGLYLDDALVRQALARTVGETWDP